MNRSIKPKHYLVIDNGSKIRALIVRRLQDGGNTCDSVVYEPGMQLSDEGYDAIVLSGGMAHEVLERQADGSFWFETEFEFIRQTSTPLLGICLGLQMINVALGGSLRHLPNMIRAPRELEMTDDSRAIFGSQSMNVFKYHQWVVDELPTTLEVIQESPDGVEIVRHKTRPFIGTQFHPEVSTRQLNAACAYIAELEQVMREADQDIDFLQAPVPAL